MNTTSLTYQRDTAGRLEIGKPTSKAELREFRQRKSAAEGVEGAIDNAHRLVDGYKARDNQADDLNPQPGLVVLSKPSCGSTENAVLRFDPVNGNASSLEVESRSERGTVQSKTLTIDLEGGLTFCETVGMPGAEGQRTLLLESPDGVVNYQRDSAPIAMLEEPAPPTSTTLLTDENGTFKPDLAAPTTLAEIPGWQAANHAAFEANRLMDDLREVCAEDGLTHLDNKKDLDQCSKRGRILFADAVYSGGDYNGDVEAEIVLSKGGGLPTFMDYSKYDDGVDEGIENRHVLFQNGPAMSLTFTERSTDYERTRELKEQEPGRFLFQES